MRLVKYYEEGKVAYRAGNTVCPYTTNSAPANNWEAGWTDAWYEDTIKEKSNG